MTQYLSIEEEQLKSSNSYWTAREIEQQPRVWREAFSAIADQQEKINQWLSPILDISALRIVLSGAGTSAFIGESLAPWMRKKLNRRVESLSTTDIVSDPAQYFAEDLPTLMISFARSGDSPESVASVDLASQVLTQCYHLILTCNPEGYLARSANSSNGANMLCLLMPEETNDRSLAMTSSFTTMLLSCAAIFSKNDVQFEKAIELTNGVIENHVDSIKRVADTDFTRLVVLGAGCLLGIAREASLKSLELSGGKVVPMFDSPLGFRHGPKSVVDKSTLIIHLQSDNPYIKSYDLDLSSELRDDNQALNVVTLSPQFLGDGESKLEDLWLSFPYIVYCQILAFFKARALNISADNPCPTGIINRVVKGVTIHSYQGE